MSVSASNSKVQLNTTFSADLYSATSSPPSGKCVQSCEPYFIKVSLQNAHFVATIFAPNSLELIEPLEVNPKTLTFR